MFQNAICAMQQKWNGSVKVLVEILLIRSEAFQLSTWIKQEMFYCKHGVINKNGFTFRKMVWLQELQFGTPGCPGSSSFPCVKTSSPGFLPVVAQWRIAAGAPELSPRARDTQRPCRPPAPRLCAIPRHTRPGLHLATTTSWQSKLMLYSL